MQFETRLQRGLADGSISVCFRRWRRPQVVAGHRYRSPIGLVLVEAVDVLASEGDITDVDARAAGYDSAAAAVADVRPPLPGVETTLYRLRLRRVDEPDPRSALAADDALSDADLAELDKRLARLDAVSKHGPWTHAVLDAIAERPDVRAADLAASFGRERLAFKLDVRKLKALGLTISLEVGYRLSPRGQAYLRLRPRPRPEGRSSKSP